MALGALVLVGCLSSPLVPRDPKELEAEARVIAGQYLSAVAARDGPAAFSTLKQEGAAGRPDQAALQAVLNAADTSRFEWQIRDVQCDPDDGRCRVEVSFPAGFASVPAALRYPGGSGTVPRFATFQHVILDGVPQPAGSMQIIVDSQITGPGVMTAACCGG